MYKKTLLGILLIFLMTMSACKGSDEVKITQPNNDTVVKKHYSNRVINIGTFHYPPFELIDNDEYKGPGIEVIIAVLDYLGYEYLFHDYPWTRNLDMIKTGEIDMLVDTFITPERREFVFYSEIPYGILPQAFFTMSDSNIEFDGDFKSLSKYTIGITRGYSYGHEFDKALKNSIITYSKSNNAENLYTKLINNRVDLVADSVYSGKEVIAKMGAEHRFTIIKPYFDNLFSYVTFSKANDLEPLKEEYDEALKTLIADGTVKNIFAKYGIEDLFDTMLQEVK